MGRENYYLEKSYYKPARQVRLTSFQHTQSFNSIRYSQNKFFLLLLIVRNHSIDEYSGSIDLAKRNGNQCPHSILSVTSQGQQAPVFQIKDRGCTIDRLPEIRPYGLTQGHHILISIQHMLKQIRAAHGYQVLSLSVLFIYGPVAKAFPPSQETRSV